MTTTHPTAGLFRRLAAMFYDALILIALFMMGTMLILPFNHGDAISSSNVFYKIYLLLIWLSFYWWFWRQKGQTVGMMAWRLKLQNTSDNNTPTTKQILIRLLTAIPSLLLCGIGLIWLLFDKDKYALYDRLSNTKVIITPRRIKASRK